jgi:sulfoxide reductase heme-binding subunit YedZ
MLSLAVTPLRSLWHWPTAMLVRRMLGVGAFAYLVLHFTLYVASQGYDLATVASEIVLRIYLTIGFVALLGMAALAATSTDGMIKRMGGKAWRWLHRLVYPLGLLAIVHFFLQARLGAIEPQVMAGLFVWAMAWRIAKAKDSAGPVVTLALGLAATLLVPAAEAGVIVAKLGAPFDLVFLANFDPEMIPRPAHVISGFVVAVCAVAFARARP